MWWPWKLIDTMYLRSTTTNETTTSIYVQKFLLVREMFLAKPFTAELEYNNVKNMWAYI